MFIIFCRLNLTELRVRWHCTFKQQLLNVLERKDYDKDMAEEINDNEEKVQLYININIVTAIDN